MAVWYSENSGLVVISPIMVNFVVVGWERLEPLDLDEHRPADGTSPPRVGGVVSAVLDVGVPGRLLIALLRRVVG